MLNALRKGAGSLVAKIFLGILALSFGLWGIGDYVTGRPDTTVAEVGGSEINVVDYQTHLSRYLRRMQVRIGRPLTREEARGFGLYEDALRELVGGKLIDEAAAEIGLVVPDEVVAQRVRQDPAYQTQSGQFDRIRFDAMLAQNGLSEQAYIALARQELRREQLLQAVGSGAVTPPSVLVDNVYQYRLEERIAEYFIVARAPADRSIEPGETTLRAFHEEHAERFTAPEYRKLTYLTLTPDDFIDEVGLSDEEILEEYQARADEFFQPTSVELDQMVFQDKAEADKAYQRLQAGEDFAAVAENMLAVDVAELTLGRVTRDNLPDQLAEVAFALADGAFSPPVETAFGWHVLRAREPRAERQTPFEEVRDQLRDDAARRLAADVMFDMTAGVDDGLASGASLTEIASSLGLSVDTIEAVDRDGRDPSGAAVADLPAAPEFLTHAFDGEVGGELTLVESDDGTFFVVQVDDVTPPALRPFETVRDAVEEAWREEERAKATAKRAEALAEKVRAGVDLGEVAREANAAVSRTEPNTRAGRGDGVLPRALWAALFAAEEGEVLTAADPASGGHIVARLAEIKVPDPGADEELVTALRQSLSQAVAGDLLAQYQAALQQEIGVTINPEAVQSVTDLF